MTGKVTPHSVLKQRLKDYPYGGDNSADDLIRTLADAGFSIVATDWKPEIHVPAADLLDLARQLQFQQTSHGDGLSLQQMATAEEIIVCLVREHLDGKWDHLRRENAA
jgi:hypothetical protein